MKIQNMGPIVKITLFRQFIALTTSANLWIDVAGYRLKNVQPSNILELCGTLLYLSAISAK